MDAIHTEDYKGYTIEIYLDEYADSPREWCNLGTMTCWHPKYKLGDFNLYRTSETPSSWFAALPKGTIALPMWLYDHSGLSISTSNGYPYNCPWDAGLVGYIWATREAILKEYGVSRLSPKVKASVLERLRQEVKTYDAFLRGEVYSYVIFKKCTCDECDHVNSEVIDSCGGFIGDSDYVLSEARSMVDGYKEEE